jgi:hypothetical protein
MTGISILPKSPLGDFLSVISEEFFGCCCFNGKLMLAFGCLGIWAGTNENLIVFSCLSFHSTPF